MAGPVLMLYAKPDLTTEIINATHAWLRDEVARAQTFGFELWECQVSKVVSSFWPLWDFQGSTEFRRDVEAGEWRPLTLGFAPFGGEISGNYQPSETLGVAELLGFLPAFNVQIYSMSNQKSDHRVIGQLALQWATRFDALIALDVKFEASFSQSLPGQYRWGEVILDYPTGPEIYQIGAADTTRTRRGHDADTTWMSAWLEHPDYFLLK